jgi:hypothetical protein
MPRPIIRADRGVKASRRPHGERAVRVVRNGTGVACFLAPESEPPARRVREPEEGTELRVK